MKYFLSIVVAFLLCHQAFCQQRQYRLPSNITESDFSADIIILKLHPGSSSNSRGGSSLKQSDIFKNININDIETALPHLESAAAARNSSAPHSLSNIYRITLREGENVIQTINQLLTNSEVIYAEPYFHHQLLYNPNDPEAAPTTGQQTYLGVIKAYNAWSIEQGDPGVVIGILDTGVDLMHEDLKDNISYNYNDPINGIDDDNDGLIDNFHGWDIANNDNTPEADTNPHGTEVSGFSSATTNNGTGIAGTGFKSKFLPIKIFLSGSNNISRGYEAIALAADLGCKVINLSWGSANSYSQFGQDVINYAVLEKDVAIIAAAGNTPNELNFYPASFNNVISVGATDLADKKTSWGTYSYNIDVLAPGINVYTTSNDNTYKSGSGSSYSSALVAGAAALVRSRYPHLNAQQVMEMIRVTSDNVYEIAGNETYFGQLGKGRLNMIKALTDITSPSLRIQNVNHSNGIGKYAFYGDTIQISMDLKNYLNKTSSATATISSNSPYIVLLDSVFNIGSLATLATTSNTGSPFKILLSNDTPPEEKITFRIDFSDGAYTDFQYFHMITSPEYLTLDNGKLAMTIASNGNLGYNKDRKVNGVGISYKGNQVLENIGLITATGTTTVVDNAPTSLTLFERSKDFDKQLNAKYHNNSIADLDVRNGFYDSAHLLDIKIEQKTLAWKDDVSNNFMILEYRIINTGANSLSGLHAAVFADWNLNDKDYNKADWDPVHNLGYVRDAESDTIYTGLALLSDQEPIYYAINNKNFNGNSANIAPSINDEKKYELVSQGIGKTSAGDTNNGNDVSHVLGGTIPLLESNQSIKVAFAVVAGNSLPELQAAVTAATNKYQSYLDKPPLLYTTYTCQGTPATINPEPGEIFEFYNDILLTGLLTTGIAYETPAVNEPQTYYAINKDSLYDGDVYRVVAAPKLVNADFTMDQSPLLLDESGKTTVNFLDRSIDGVAWQWNFDNGYTATVQNPLMNYYEPGSYDIDFSVTNDLGCVENVSKTLEVAYRSNKPDIRDQFICLGDALNLSASNATLLKVYSDAPLSQEIYSGDAFTTTPIYSDTTFYIISVDSLYESLPTKVNIAVSDVKADFSYTIDTVDLTSKTLLHFTNQSKNEALYYWYTNDQLQMVNEELGYHYDDQNPFEIKLIAEDINGCFDTLKQIITPKISTTPGITDFSICKEETLLIQPENGQVFYFYRDPDLTDLQYKGKYIYLNDLVADTSIYVSNIDSLKESNAVEVKINVSDLQAQFSTLILPESDGTNKVINESIGAITYLWLLNGDTISIEENPVITVPENATYNLQLFVTDELGCKDSISHLMEFKIITSVEDKLKQEIEFYPNPASDRIYIKNRGDAQIELLTTNGHTIQWVPLRENFIELIGLPDGVYFVRIEMKGVVFYRKVVKQAK